MLSDPAMIAFLLGISLAAGGLTVALYTWLSAQKPGPSHLLLQGLHLPRTYTFRDGYLISEIDQDDPFLGETDDRAAAWDNLAENLEALTDEARNKLTALRAHNHSFVLIGRIGTDELSISGRSSEGRVIITVSSLDARQARRSIDQAGLDALEEEVMLMRAAVEHGDDVKWQVDEEGRIIWANARYFALSQRLAGQAGPASWPIGPLFRLPLTQPKDSRRSRRVSLQLADQDNLLWFDIACKPYHEGRLYTARPIDQLITAETSLQDFIQTLSRTFAHLPTALAIFDKRRELVLFNPALVSLSTLRTEWLSSRPDLFAFLDQLREKQRMPEPKDYQVWRDSLVELEQAAQEGTYQDLWNLPDGQTFRVLGRPHADGGIAFMFEDISSEVLLTRKFRGDLDLYQAALDDGEEAIAVFAQDGTRMLTNQSYLALWPEEAEIDAQTVIGSTRIWQSHCTPSPLWGELRDFVGGYVEREAWDDIVTCTGGRKIACRISALAGGATLVGFRVTAFPDGWDNTETAPKEAAPERELAVETS